MLSAYIKGKRFGFTVASVQVADSQPLSYPLGEAQHYQGLGVTHTLDQVRNQQHKSDAGPGVVSGRYWWDDYWDQETQQYQALGVTRTLY